MEITPDYGAEEAKSAKPVRLGWADASRLTRKLAVHTGKAAWTFGTSFLVLIVPLIVQLHREEQLIELEKEQLGVLNQPTGLQAEWAARGKGTRARRERFRAVYRGEDRT